MRILTACLAALSLLAADAPAQSPSTSPLDKPAERSGIRRSQSAEPPLGSTSGRELEATSAPRVGLETWVARAKASSPAASDQSQLRVRFYRVENPNALNSGGLAPKVAPPVPRPQNPWSMSRADSRSLAQLLYKFVEWSDVADKNRVQVVDKEIGQLKYRSQSLWFHREKEAGPTKSWLIVNDTYQATQIYRLSAVDVAALLELLDKLPALDDQLLNRTGPKPPTVPPPAPPTEELFK